MRNFSHIVHYYRFIELDDLKGVRIELDDLLLVLCRRLGLAVGFLGPSAGLFRVVPNQIEDALDAVAEVVHVVENPLGADGRIAGRSALPDL